MPQGMSEEQAKALQEKLKSMSPEELREFQKQQCLFCQIVAGKVPAKKVYEDEHSIAIMDINPAAPGHVLILPKEHYAIMPQVPDKEAGHLFLVAKYLSQVLLKVLKVSGTTVFIANGLVAGQRAQHFIMHLIPRKEGDGLLPSEEKYIEVSVQQKVQQLVEGRLNQLLGLKKEVVRAEEKQRKEAGEEKPKKAERAEAAATVPKKKEDQPQEESKKKEAKEEAEEEAEEEEAEEEQEDETELDESEEKEKPSATKTKDDEGISLDDIAKLFT